MHVIGVRDHGIGIPPDEQERVLTGYYRAKNATALEVHGTGLGLLVTKKIVEQHHGKLWLESKLNIGTTFYISLPIANHTAETTSTVIPTPSDKLDKAPAKTS
jgi:two-component system sensor histidine kinase VicK